MKGQNRQNTKQSENCNLAHCPSTIPELKTCRQAEMNFKLNAGSMKKRGNSEQDWRHYAMAGGCLFMPPGTSNY